MRDAASILGQFKFRRLPGPTAGTCDTVKLNQKVIFRPPTGVHWEIWLSLITKNSVECFELARIIQ